MALKIKREPPKKKKKNRASTWPMSSSQKYAFIKNNILRKHFKLWPAYGMALRASKVEVSEPSKTGRTSVRRVYFRCARCNYLYKAPEVCVDHINPVVKADEWSGDWNEIVDGMFCDVDNLQVLCNYKGTMELENGQVVRSCHYFKSREERGQQAQDEPRTPKNESDT